MGIVPARLGKILAPNPEPPMENKKASTKRLQKGRVLTSSQIVGKLSVRDVKISIKHLVICGIYQ
ncbi:hypothetical protein DPMN_070241 [Dreissena polymorpha]|uniref:Uncharacterized protein n=1 Tax=Dreissena polymorpha TaxID=45954 RepID=A0A9D4BVH9_DREPO|nr:hypothetical protein DPMN_070241 [Dreissena polymorpha]